MNNADRLGLLPVAEDWHVYFLTIVPACRNVTPSDDVGSLMMLIFS